VIAIGCGAALVGLLPAYVPLDQVFGGRLCRAKRILPGREPRDPR